MLWSTGKQCIVSDEFWNIAAKKINFNTLSQKEIVVLCSEAKSDHVGTLAIEASTLDLDARMDILIQSHFSHALIKILLNKNIIDIIDLIESIKMKNPDNWGDMFPKELFIYLQ
jgi:hypothetical protein